MNTTNIYFKNAEYHTPDTAKRSIWDIVSMGTNLYFNIRFLYFLFRNRRFVSRNNYGTARWAESSFEIMKFTEDCGGKYHIKGFDNVEKVKNEPVVFISNHMSTLETMVFPCLIAPVKEVTFVVKDTLISSKLFGPIMRARNPISVTRKDTRKDLITVMSQGLQKLKEGTSIIIFPQSTRTDTFIPEEFNSLGVKLALKANVKVVPMAIKTDFWGTGKLIKDWGIVHRKKPIHIEFGEPIEITGTGKEEHAKIVEFIETRVRKWEKEG